MSATEFLSSTSMDLGIASSLAPQHFRPRVEEEVMSDAGARRQHAAAAAPETVRRLQSGCYPVLPARNEKAGTLRSPLTDLRQICERVMRALAGVAYDKGVTLEVAHFANEVAADPAMLSHTLFDLLYHQIVRARAGSTLTVLTTPRPRLTEIRIIDWGAAGAAAVSESPLPVAGSRDLAEALEALRAHGGECSVEMWAGSLAICVKFPNAP